MKRFLWSAFAVLLVATGLIASDYTRTYVLDWGPPGDTRTEMLDKLDDQVDEIVTWMNELKDGYAGTGAPSTPNEGQLWYDSNVPESMKQYHASTWAQIWSYADSNSINLDVDTLVAASVDALSASIDVLEANTFTAPYGSVTDMDVLTAEIGSMQVNTLTTSNWTQDTATFNTLTFSNTVDPANMPEDSVIKWNAYGALSYTVIANSAYTAIGFDNTYPGKDEGYLLISSDVGVDPDTDEVRYTATMFLSSSESSGHFICQVRSDEGGDTIGIGVSAFDAADQITQLIFSGSILPSGNTIDNFLMRCSDSNAPTGTMYLWGNSSGTFFNGNLASTFLEWWELK